MSCNSHRLVRKYRPEDRDAVRWICCQTGMLGHPIDPVFQDRELFADYLTSYYTDMEPESCFVVEHRGKVVGYLIGSRDHARRKKFQRKLLIKLLLKGLWRLVTLQYNAATRKYIGWIIFRGWREIPEAPKDTPHFHINLLPEGRSVSDTYRLIQSFLDYLVEKGEKNVCGQMVVYDGKRGPRMFARYGWKILNWSRITKFEQHHPKPVYLYTVAKDLTTKDNLTGTDNHKTQSKNVEAVSVHP